MENAIQCNQKNALTVGFHDWLSLHSHWCQLFAARNYRHWEIQATTQPSCVQGSLYAIVHLLVSLQQRSPVKSSNVQEGARLKWTISLDKTYNHANINWNGRRRLTRFPNVHELSLLVLKSSRWISTLEWTSLCVSLWRPELVWKHSGPFQ